jgi:hypothetical protein
LSTPDVQTDIRPLQNTAEVEICARMMVSTEPWIRLQRTFDETVKIITDPSREVYCAINDGKITGFIIIVMQGAFIGYIRSICVESDWSFNKGAQKLYKRLGYKTVGKLKDYVVAGHSEILLRKTIAPLTEFKRP